MPKPSDRYEPLPGLLEIPGFLLRKLSPSARRLAIAIAALTALAALAGAVLAIPRIHSGQQARAAADARHAAATRRALLARYAREARPLRGQGPAAHGLTGPAALDARRTLVGDLQAAVLADARRRAPRHGSQGEYRSSTCWGYPKQVVDRPPAEDLSRASAVMECLAVTAHVSPGAATSGSLIGQPYRALVRFDRGRFAWCQIVQMPGELSIARESVLEVPTACGGRR